MHEGPLYIFAVIVQMTTLVLKYIGPKTNFATFCYFPLWCHIIVFSRFWRVAFCGKAEPTITRQRRSWLQDCGKSDIYDIQNSKCLEVCHPWQCVAVDEVIIRFKWKIVFQQCIKRIKRFGKNKCTNFVSNLVTRVILSRKTEKPG